MGRVGTVVIEPFEKVYDEHYGSIYNAVYMRILNRESTEDIVQDIFIKAFRAYDRFDPKLASVSTWLNRIATNTLYDHFRKNGTIGGQISRQAVSVDDCVEQGMEPGVEDSELTKLIDEQASEAYVILKHLKPEERELLSLRFGLELSYKEIAEQVNAKEKAVGARINRILEKCRRIADSERI